MAKDCRIVSDALVGGSEHLRFVSDGEGGEMRGVACFLQTNSLLYGYLAEWVHAHLKGLKVYASMCCVDADLFLGDG